MTPYDYRVVLTEKERTQLEKVIEMLEPYVDKDTCGYIHYVVVDGDDLGSEYQSCNNAECIHQIEKEVNKIYKGKEIEFNWQHNNNDFESLERCSICFEPLNEWLTWISEEFYHHQEHTKTKEDIINQAFDLKAIFQSYPSNDKDVSYYAVHQSKLGNQEPLEKSIKYRDEFKKEVMEYCELVINQISK